ncbi:YmfL family putative regulatory protein [Duganella sp. Root336D2]|uniref:YmfL family putative regulatory protein n=1 Tax=Duganella sp. Root336D2 TaxID=1736518 RepID=UPI000B0E104A|nr:YmfL family putative regulatory protein [Duganella sp. Root336D2]
MELLAAYQEMIKVHGWAGTAATLGLTKSALEQRVYEVKGSGMRVDTALLIQRYASTTHFAQAVAYASGGVFYELPQVGDLSDEEIQDKILELNIELGELSQALKKAKADNVIDDKECAQLQEIGQRMHKSLRELNALIILQHHPMRNPAMFVGEVANG